VPRQAGLDHHHGSHELDLIVPVEPPGMVLIPAIGIQGFGVNDDHELNRLRAEALSKWLIGSLGHIGPPAFPFCWLRRDLGTHGLSGAAPHLLTGLAGAALLSCPCPLSAAARPHRSIYDSCKLFSDNAV
jgi:hypothetical protein